MADPIMVAQRRADALHRFDAEAAKLVDSLGIKAPEPVPQEINRDAELRKVCELERVVSFLAEINAVHAKPAIAPALAAAKVKPGPKPATPAIPTAPAKAAVISAPPAAQAPAPK